MARTIATANPERQNRLIFIGAVAFALIAAVLVFAALRGVGDGNGGGGSTSFANTVDVVVAANDISAGTKLSGDMLQLATLPANGIVEGALTTRDGLDGLVVRQDMAKGEQFTAAKVGQNLQDDEKTLSAVIPQGMRAAAVKVTEQTMVGGLIVPGDHVDVIAVIQEKGSGGSTAAPRAVTLLQDVEVLAVAQDAQKPVTRLDKDGNPIQTDTSSGELSTRPDDLSPNEKAKTVTLSVSPEDAALVALVQADNTDTQVTVFLSLRGNGDEDTSPVGPVTLGE